MKHFFLGVATLISFLQINAQSCYQFLKSIPGDISTWNYTTYSDGVGLGNMLFDQKNDLYLTGRGAFFLTKYSNTGSYKWSVSKPGQLAADMEIYNSKHIYVTSINATLCKFDTAGNELITPVSVNNFTPTAITVDPNENIYVAGKSYNQSTCEILIMKFNSAGNAIWTNTLSNSCNGYRTADIVAGTNGLFLSALKNNTSCTATLGTCVLNNAPSIQYAKIDFNGNCIWLKGIIGNTVTPVISRAPITLNNAGNLIISSDSLYVKDGNGNYVQSINVLESQHIKAYNNKIAMMRLNATYSNYTSNYVVDLSSPTSFTNTVSFVSNQYSSDEDYNLLSFDNLGNLFAAYSTATPMTIPSYVDLCQIPPGGGVCLARYNQYYRLYPQYTSTTITCGDTVRFGGKTLTSSDPEGGIMSSSYQNVTFSWLPATGLSSNSIYNPKAYPNTSMVYTVTVDGNCPTTVSVTNNNTSSFAYTTNSMVATFSINNTACSSFLWDFGNGNTSSINPNPTVTYATPGTYGVCLKCNGQPNTCVKCINITVPSNSSGAIGIEEITNDTDLWIYPNPSSGKFTIDKGDHADGILTITNVLGATVYSSLFSGEKINLELQLKAGIYFVEMKQTRHSSIRKIVVQ
jgi:PKD repeat protein